LRGSLIAKHGCLLLLLVVIAFYFYGLGSFPLVGPDEPRYAQVAREMFLRGDLITPTLAGHAWFEKPVLLYWLMQLSYALFGVSEATARLGPAACGVLTVLAVYWLGKRVEKFPNTGPLPHFACSSAIMLATMFGMIVFSRGASFDVVLTMTLTWALCSFLAAVLSENGNQRRWCLIAFYGSVGLSLLAKGLVGLVIPLGVILFFRLLLRSFPSREFAVSLLWGLPISLAVSALWYGPVINRHGWKFIDQFFIQHHFARYVSDKYHHPQPIYFYLPILMALMLPWFPIIVRAVINLKRLDWRGSAEVARLRVFACAWIIAPVLFFSFSKSKLPGYVLPVLPAFALLGGLEVSKLLAGNEKRSLTIRLTALLFLFLSACGIVYGGLSGQLSIVAAAIITAPALVAGLIGLFVGDTHWRLASLALAVPLSFALALTISAPQIAAAHSTADLLRRANERGYQSAAVYQLHEIDRSAEFYAAGRLAYDAAGEPLKLEGAFEVLKVALQRREPILVIVPVRYVDQLTSLPQANSLIIADNGELAIVAVTAKG
jgi:4-amino-4-deoxy-L-arabinose transferase-like glycosyltransferase